MVDDATAHSSQYTVLPTSVPLVVSSTCGVYGVGVPLPTSTITHPLQHCLVSAPLTINCWESNIHSNVAAASSDKQHTGYYGNGLKEMLPKESVTWDDLDSTYENNSVEINQNEGIQIIDVSDEELEEEMSSEETVYLSSSLYVEESEDNGSQEIGEGSHTNEQGELGMSETNFSAQEHITEHAQTDLSHM